MEKAPSSIPITTSSFPIIFLKKVLKIPPYFLRRAIIKWGSVSLKQGDFEWFRRIKKIVPVRINGFVSGQVMILGIFGIVWPLEKGKVWHPVKFQAKTKNEDLASSIRDDARSLFILKVTLEWYIFKQNLVEHLDYYNNRRISQD